MRVTEKQTAFVTEVGIYPFSGRNKGVVIVVTKDKHTGAIAFGHDTLYLVTSTEWQQFLAGLEAAREHIARFEES